jgi:hypothetical protein
MKLIDGVSIAFLLGQTTRCLSFGLKGKIYTGIKKLLKLLLG